jgi:HlyD family secretion protein
MARKWIKRVLLAVAAAVAIGGLAWAMREQPALVDVAAITLAPMQVGILEEGTTRVKQVYTVSAPIAGYLARISLRAGDHVAAGKTVIARIYPLDPPLIDRRTQAELVAMRDAARSGVGIAEIELQRAEAAHRIVNGELERALKLFGPGIISESALERAKNQVELARKAVEAADATVAFRRAELASAEARLLPTNPNPTSQAECCVEVFAPVDGVVLTVISQSEQAVAAGAALVSVGNTDDLEIVVDLLSSDAVRVSPGTPATITGWGGDANLPATLVRVGPSAVTTISALGIEEQRVETTLRLDRQDPRMGHNYQVWAELTTWECAACLQVPISALFREGNEWNVFLVDGDRLRQVELSIGHMNSDVAELIGGAKAGDRVVVHPADTLAADARVAVRQEQ